MSLTENQQIAFDSCRTNNSNCVILGPPGSGKTFIIQQLSQSLGCAITATTGLAATLIGGQTIHRYLGVLETADESATVAMQNSFLRQRIEETQMIIIDEASMLSAYLLDVINEILQRVKHSKQPFGGVKICLFGDMLQLPPVPSSSDPGEYFFQAECWTASSFQMQNLTGSHRQRDEALSRCIKQCALGATDNEVMQLLKGRSVPLPPPSAVYLAALNTQVALYNAHRLGEVSGKLHKLSSKDDGCSRVLDSVTSVTRQLYLKTNCPVIVTYNVDRKIANGTRAVVTSITTEHIVIKLLDGSVYHLQPVTVYRRHGHRLHSRTQFPLKLAYGLTIHKAQGQTFDKVHIECEGLFAPGHLSVALSRVRELTDITLSNLDESHIKPASETLIDFLTNGKVPDLSPSVACSSSSTSDEEPAFTPVQVPSYRLTPNSPQSTAAAEYPADLWDSEVAFRRQLWGVLTCTTFDESAHLISKDHLLRRLNQFPFSKEWNDMKKCCSVPNSAKVIFDEVKEVFYRSLRMKRESNQPPTAPSEYNLSPSERGRIRYIGGSYLHRLLKQFHKKLEDALVHHRTVECEQWKKLSRNVKELLVPANYSSEDPQSLHDTEVRERYHLLRISDEAAAFFYSLWCGAHSVYEKTITRSTPQRVVDLLLSSTPIRTQFKALFHSYEESTEEIYTKLVKMVNITNLRERIKVRKQKIAKTYALRKQVLMTKNVAVDPSPMEVATELEVVSQCAGCQQESTTADHDAWIQCTSCENWYHEACSDLSADDFLTLTSTDEASWDCEMCTPF